MDSCFLFSVCSITRTSLIHIQVRVFPLKTEKDIPAEHTLSHRYALLCSYLLPRLRPGPTPSGIACSVCTVDLASCSNVMQCKENFFMIVRSYTTDYGLVKINMIIFLNYFQFSPDTSAWWSELLHGWPVLRLHSRKPLLLPEFPVNMP